MVQLPDLLKIRYNWTLDDLARLTPLQLSLTPYHDDYRSDRLSEVQFHFINKRIAFLDRRIAAARSFAPLMEILQTMKAEGHPTPFRSRVASQLVQLSGGWEALGYRGWREYGDAAVDWGFVTLIPDDRKKTGARIEAVPGVRTPLESPLSFTSHDLPLLWSLDPEKEHLSREQLVDLPTQELVCLHLLLQNRTLAGHAREDFLTRREEEDGKEWSREGKAWLDAIVPRTPTDYDRSPWQLPSSTSTFRPYASSRYPSPLDHDQRPSILKRRVSPPPLAPRSVNPPPPPAPHPLPAPAPPAQQPTTPPRSPTRGFNIVSAPSQRPQALPALTPAAPANPPPAISADVASSRIGFQSVAPDNVTPLPRHLTRQLRVLAIHFRPTASSLAFPSTFPLPDAAVQRLSEGAARVLNFAYATQERVMLALQELSSADTVERVDLVDAEEGEWFWKDVLAVSEWAKDAWRIEMEQALGEQLQTIGKRGRDEEEGSAVKRAREG